MTQAIGAGETSDSSITAIYGDKPSSYFGNARNDIIAMLPANGEAAVLELGCGSGGTGRAALTAGRAKRYVGIELIFYDESESR